MHGADLSGWRLELVGVLALIAGSQLASALANWLSTLLITPQLLPRMDYSQGLPQENPTLVVVPSLLSSERNVEELLDALEVRFLGNQDPNLLFGLLTDFCDADKAELPEDGPPARAAPGAGIELLNEKYRAGGTSAVLPVPPAAQLESARADLDGLRAQARQAGGPEPAAARRRARPLLAHRR